MTDEYTLSRCCLQAILIELQVSLSILNIAFLSLESLYLLIIFHNRIQVGVVAIIQIAPSETADATHANISQGPPPKIVLYNPVFLKPNPYHPVMPSKFLIVPF